MSVDAIINKTVTVRKDHRCEWCGEPVSKGSKALRRKYVFDGVFHDTRQHHECYEAMLSWDDPYEDGFTFGEMERGQPCSKDQQRDHERWLASQA